MGNFKVVDQDSYVPDQGVILDDEDIVDRDGYRDTQAMVEEMIYAGERLQAFRREEFDYEDGKEEYLDDVNPTVEQGFDIIDAQRQVAELNKRIAAARAVKVPEPKEVAAEAPKAQ